MPSRRVELSSKSPFLGIPPRAALPLLCRLFSSRFLLCCLLTDFQNPIYSPVRMKLMDYVPTDLGE